MRWEQLYPSDPLTDRPILPISNSPSLPTPTNQPQQPSSPIQTNLNKRVGTYTFGEVAPPPKFGSTMTMSYKVFVAK